MTRFESVLAALLFVALPALARPSLQVDLGAVSSWKEQGGGQDPGLKIGMKAKLKEGSFYGISAGIRYLGWNITHLYEVKHDSGGRYLNPGAHYYSLPDSRAHYLGGIAEMTLRKRAGFIDFFLGLGAGLDVLAAETSLEEDVLIRCFQPRNQPIPVDGGPRNTAEYCVDKSGHYDRGELYPVVLNLGISPGIGIDFGPFKVSLYPTLERNVTPFRKVTGEVFHSKRATLTSANLGVEF